ncbi:hypothetical protein PanWU01x14_104810 [Parasponia andersonii]|uniref:Uncharacterized protein n=1 Tax=Parasponia andersonii TaxID=3476 RepID=A0A2P5D1A3_PARAD|nr:hypothetical protein PanWU01x14_104810 [Parasponia andersonii]
MKPLSIPVNKIVLVNVGDIDHTTCSDKLVASSDIPDELVLFSNPAKSKKSEAGDVHLKLSSSPKPTPKKKALAKEKGKAKVKTPRTTTPSSPEIKTLLKKAYNFSFYTENL